MSGGFAHSLSQCATVRRAFAARHMSRGEAAYARKRFFSALRRWRVAHSAGSSGAAFRIAELYVKGEGVQRNLAEAVKWYRRAAECDHPRAQFRLGQVLLNGAQGGGVTKWYGSASACDSELAQRNAEALFPSGFEVLPNPDEALRWLDEAARNGEREADGVVGAVYLDGRVRPRDFALARQRLEAAAGAGVASAQFHLGDMLFRGLGQPSDPAAAADWYERAAGQGHVRGCVAIGSLLVTAQGRPRDKAAAGAWFEKAAEAERCAGALPRCGIMRLSGDGLPRNIIRAESYLRRAAKKDDLPAILALAEFYSRGAHVEPDLREAYVWYRKAAELGDGRAQFITGRLCATGAGVVANLRESARWFLRSAKNGDPIAAHNVACLYARGDGVEKDADAAAQWFRTAAEMGVAASQVALAHALLSDENGERDAEGARAWLEKAVAGGSPEAKVSLASLHLTGEDAPRDPERAALLLREAAEAGFTPAARNLGHMRSGQFDCPADFEDAARWYRIGAEAGDAESQYCLALLLRAGKGVAKSPCDAVEQDCGAPPRTAMQMRPSNSVWRAAPVTGHPAMSRKARGSTQRHVGGSRPHGRDVQLGRDAARWRRSRGRRGKRTEMDSESGGGWIDGSTRGAGEREIDALFRSSLHVRALPVIRRARAKSGGRSFGRSRRGRWRFSRHVRMGSREPGPDVHRRRRRCLDGSLVDVLHQR